MKTRWVKLALLSLLIIASLLTWKSGILKHINFETFKEQHDILLAYVREHTVFSSAVFTMLFMLTAFFLPGAIVMTIAAGALFGVVRGTAFVVVGGTVGAAVSFLLSRYLVGNWFQEKYSMRLREFNRETRRHGYNYLLTLRIIPVAPFFVINFVAGLTKIRAWTFIWTTSAGMLPGALVYTFAGREIGSIESPSDVMSFKMISAFIMLALFTLLPVFKRHFMKN